jgi:uncharacterized protein (DUF885 family)
MSRSSAARVLFALLVAGLAPTAHAAPAPSHPAPGNAPGPVARLHDLFDREWTWRLKESPELASNVGVHDYDDQLSDVSPETLARQTKETEAFLAELDKIDRATLPAAEQANYDILPPSSTTASTRTGSSSRT